MRFNRICLGLALLWLAVTVPVGIVWRPTIPDFGQFYLGGLVASRGDWSSLYPLPVLGSLDNAGLSYHSFAKPLWRTLGRKHGVPDYTHFILPPPSALLFSPLALVSYRKAFWIFTFVLAAAAWGTALCAARLFRCVVGSPSRWEGVLALLIVLSPTTARAIRIANVSPLIALSIGVALLALVRRAPPARGALAVLAGALLKYATLILLPLFVAMRRWRTLLWLAGLGALALGATLALAGPKPFAEFVHAIVPTLSRPSWFRGNQSLPGMLARIFGRPFRPWLNFTLTFARVITLECVLAVLLTLPQRHWRNPVNVLAAAGLLIGWLLVFSPIAWEHWPVFLCPVWGWLLWEALRGGARRYLALASLALLYFPAGILQVSGIARYPILLPEPYNSTQLFGVLLLTGLGFTRLAARVAWIRARPSGEPAPGQKLAEMGNLESIQK